LGRSGSDYTASILGAALRAQEIWIWKEVDGVCTADPNLVRSARVVPRISYQEAAEMAHYGAEVIHPKTMMPARRGRIPIRIKNTFKPDAPGTLITARPGSRGAAPLLVSSIDGMALVTVEGTGIFGQPGMILRLLTPVANAGTNIYMISMSSSEYNVSFAIMQGDLDRTMKALEKDFRDRGLLGEQVARITVERDMSAIAVVGAGMKGQHGIAGRVFSALGDAGVNVVAIAQGSSEYNITVVLARWKETVETGGGLEGRKMLRQARGVLSGSAVLVDATAEEGMADLYCDAFSAGFHVVSCNKKPLAGSLADYRRVKEASRRKHRFLLYEVTG